MTEAEYQQLKKACPNVFANGAFPECGSGWFKIILKAATAIEKEIRILQPQMRTHFYATQIKEKFGALRFYMSSYTRPMGDWIALAEESSRLTCETCGAKGKLRGTDWFYTACKKHTKPEDRK